MSVTNIIYGPKAAMRPDLPAVQREMEASESPFAAILRGSTDKKLSSKDVLLIEEEIRVRQARQALSTENGDKGAFAFEASGHAEILSVPKDPTTATNGTDQVNVTAPEQKQVPAQYRQNDASNYDNIISYTSTKVGVSQDLIRAVIKTESNFNQFAVSPVGAKGLMQLMPATAKDLGVTDAFDARQNIYAGARFLKDMLNRYNGDIDKALAAYNWGPGNVDKGKPLPKETREYLVKVKNELRRSVG